MCSTDVGSEDATVVVIIEDMLIRTNLTTWRLSETNWELCASITTWKLRDLIGDLNRLKPHRVVSIICLVLCEKLLVHRS